MASRWPSSAPRRRTEGGPASRGFGSSSSTVRARSKNGTGRCPHASTGGQAGGRCPWQQCQCAGVGLVGLDAQRRSNSHTLDKNRTGRSPVGGARDALSRRSTLPMNTGTLPPPWSVMTELVQPCSSRPRVRRARNCWTAVSRAQIDPKIRLPGHRRRKRRPSRPGIRRCDSVVGRSVCRAWWCPRMNGNSTALGQNAPGVEASAPVRLELPGVG